MEYTNFSRWYTPVSLYFVLGALHLVAIEIYATIELAISVLENYTWPLPRNDPERMGGYTQPTWRKLNLPLNVSQKFTLQNANPILLITILSLFYINVLRKSDTFTDVMSSLSMLLATFLSWINKYYIYILYIYIYI